MFSQTLTVKTCGMASTRHTLKAVGSFPYAKLSRYTLAGIIPTCNTLKVHSRCGGMALKVYTHHWYHSHMRNNQSTLTLSVWVPCEHAIRAPPVRKEPQHPENLLTPKGHGFKDWGFNLKTKQTQ